RKITNKEAGLFIAQQGVVILKETKKPLTEDIATLDARLFVPMHMISYIETETTPLTGNVPRNGDEGVLLQ
ncbi:MAG: hypothetical protein OK457_00115, partial [Thaumarchaeota archaeon]|nr:hypothetical protein [Nitrososphaerota archaeon]